MGYNSWGHKEYKTELLTLSLSHSYLAGLLGLVGRSSGVRI